MEVIITITIYLGLAFVFSKLLPVAFYSKYNSDKSLAWIMLLLIPSLLAAFRKGTGTDSLMYMKAYENWNSLNRWQDMESGFIWICNSLKKFHISYQGMFFLMEILTIFFMLLFIKREKEYIDVRLAGFIICIDFYLNSFNAMRQMLAVSMVLYGFSLFNGKKYISSFIIILCACTFHGSALIGMAIFVAKIIFDNRYSKLMYALCSVTVLYFIFHRNLLGKFVYIITGSNYYASYITRDAESEGSITGYFIKLLPILLFSVIQLKNIIKNNQFKVYYGLMLIGYFFSLLGNITETQVHRAGWYFSYLNIIIMPFCSKYDLTLYGNIILKKKYLTYIIYFYYFVMFIYNFIIKGFSELVPYKGLF